MSKLREDIEQIQARKSELKHKYRYIRVGVDFYRVIEKSDRWGQTRSELKPWTRQVLIDDHGKEFLKEIPQYNDFTMEPCNTDYQQVINGCYNKYTLFIHKPQPGEWTWTKILLEHVFGEQYELGIRYFQILYLYPKHMLPILCLVSKERQTGKTTFVNWLDMMFGPNMVTIGSSDLGNGFNQYATANLICVEEALVDKQVSIEKLKAYSTAKVLTVNEKFMRQYKLPFYGKFIVTSNMEDKFARIDQEEIRFFVRKLCVPQNHNHKIESDLLSEISAFLHHLATLPPVDFSTDRTGFTPAELSNGALDNLKNESKSWLYHELVGLFEDYFANAREGGEPVNECKCSLLDIKNRWFQNNRDVTHRFLKHTLTNEFSLTVPHPQRYTPFNEANTRTGRPYTFTSLIFNCDENDKPPF